MGLYEAILALFLFIAGVLAVSVSAISAWNGYAWQAFVFGLGGIYVVVWSALRLVEAERRLS
jgi:hypothetical protein